MQSLGFSPSVCVRERLIWTARPFYHFLFLEISNLKIYSFSKNTFIKGKLLFFNQLPPAPHFALWEKACMLDWGWKQMGRVGVKPEIENAAPGPVWRWLVLQAWCFRWAEGQWDSRGHQRSLSLVPSPSPLEVLLFSKGVFQNPFSWCSRVDR